MTRAEPNDKMSTPPSDAVYRTFFRKDRPTEWVTVREKTWFQGRDRARLELGTESVLERTRQSARAAEADALRTRDDPSGERHAKQAGEIARAVERATHALSRWKHGGHDVHDPLARLVLLDELLRATLGDPEGPVTRFLHVAACRVERMWRAYEARGRPVDSADVRDAIGGADPWPEPKYIVRQNLRTGTKHLFHKTPGRSELAEPALSACGIQAKTAELAPGDWKKKPWNPSLEDVKTCRSCALVQERDHGLVEGELGL